MTTESRPHFVAQGWKDLYLRNIVAQTTHAAMLAQQQVQSLFESRAQKQVQQKPQTNFNRDKHHPAQRYYFPSLARAHSSLLKQTKEGAKYALADEEDELRNPAAAAAAAVVERNVNLCDADWKRWRRINPTGVHKRKEAWAAALPRSPTTAPSSSLRSLSAKQQRKMPQTKSSVLGLYSR